MQCPAHRAVDMLLSRGCLPEDEASPSLADWDAVLRESIAGNPTALSGIAGVGSGKKVRRMQWCLAEAKRDLSRKHLRDAVAISISQDMRATRFLIKFRCASPTLEVHEGIVDLRREAFCG